MPKHLDALARRATERRSSFLIAFARVAPSRMERVTRLYGSESGCLSIDVGKALLTPLIGAKPPSTSYQQYQNRCG